MYRIVFVTIVLTLITIVCGVPVKDEIKQIACDIDAINESCPEDFCCVRDEFVYSETYCRQYGKANKPCGTRPSQFECPCEPGYRCATNIHGHVTSLFGKCFPIPGLTTDSTLGYVTSDLPEVDISTTEESLDYGGTKDGNSKQGTTEDVTKGHTQYSDGDIVVG